MYLQTTGAHSASELEEAACCLFLRMWCAGQGAGGLTLPSAMLATG